jgi:hypothetical protein
MPRFHTGPAALARLGVAATLAAGAALGSVGVVGAYPAPAGGATMSTSCGGSVAAGVSCPFTFTLVDGSNHAVNAASVSFSLTGLSTGSVTGSGTTNSAGVASGTLSTTAPPTPGTGADCGKTGTITGTSGSVTAQSQITITCPTGGPVGGLLHNIIGTIVTDLTGGILRGVLGGSTYNLTVPAGSLPAGTHVDFLSPTAADLTSVTALLPAGTSLASVFDIVWPAAISANSPITLVIHNAAFHAGHHIYKLVNGSLQPYSSATVTEGVATITFSNDPVFAVVAPTASVPGGLGNEGGAPTASPSSGSTRAYAIVAGALLVLALVAAPVLRRRREQV